MNFRYCFNSMIKSRKLIKLKVRIHYKFCGREFSSCLHKNCDYLLYNAQLFWRNSRRPKTTNVTSFHPYPCSMFLVFLVHTFNCTWYRSLQTSFCSTLCSCTVLFCNNENIWSIYLWFFHLRNASNTNAIRLSKNTYKSRYISHCSKSST